MSKETFQQDALILAAHGSTLNSDSARPAWELADQFRKQRLFARVQETFWKQEPYFWMVRRMVFEPRVFIVPLFISEGYFTEEVLPRELGFLTPGETGLNRVRRDHGQTLVYSRPVGTHSSMSEVLLESARQVVESHPFPRVPPAAETALFIAGHGTGNNENSRKAIEEQVSILSSRKIYAEVHPVFMEEEPRIERCYEMTQARNLVVVPFFISDGLHSFEDIPVMLGESKNQVQSRLAQGQPTWRNPTEKKGKWVWYARSIGTNPTLSQVILHRVREAANWIA